MIIFLTEEPSIKPVIEKLMQELSPDSDEGVDWLVSSFCGKADLEAKMNKKIRGWSYGEPYFIILRDNDGGDCLALKQRLVNKAKHADKNFSVRIVCQELEAWFIGDLSAVEKAYPKSRTTKMSCKEKYRIPDTLTNAAQLLTEMTGVRAKIGRAEKISNHLSVLENNSKSFQVFRDKLTELLA